MRSRYNLIIHFALFFILPLIILLSFLNIQTEKDYLANKEIQDINNLANTQNQLAFFFDNVVISGRSVTTSEAVKKYMKDPKNENNEKVTSDILSSLVAQNNTIKYISIYNNDGKLMSASTNFSDGNYPNTSVASFAYDISINNGFTNINKYQIEGSKTNFFSYVCKIYDGNSVLGYCVEYHDLTFFDKLIANVNSTSEFNVMLTDFSGNIIHSSSDNIQLYSEYAEYNNLFEVFKNVTSNKLNKITTYKFNGTKKLILGNGIPITKNFNGNTWGILYTTTQDQYMRSYYDQKEAKQIFIIPLMIAFGIFGIAYIIFYTSPIDKLNNLLSRYLLGDKAARYKSKGKSDIVKIGNTVNRVLNDLSEITELYNLVINMTDNIIFEYNVNKNTVVFSDNFNSKFSFRAKTLKFSDSFFVNAVVHRKENSDFQSFIDMMLTGASKQGEFRFKTLYNDYAWHIIRSASIKDQDNNVVKIIGTMIDIDRAKRREENLLKKANFDSLTQIFNRLTFELTLLNEIELSQMRKSNIALLFIDIDDFKYYNNDFGHALGDEVLVFISSSLKKLVANNGFAGRYGGDEFVICYNESDDVPNSGEFAQDIIDTLSEGFDSTIIDKHFTVKCSIGIAYCNDASMQTDSLIKDADEAMYNVKKNGKSGYAYYANPRKTNC